MKRQHIYNVSSTWTGNSGSGTSDYRSYERSHVISVENKVAILCSSDPAFRGDKTKYNPEELLVASLAGCHMLSYLHLCSVAGIVVTEYVDHATGTMEETDDGSGHFTEVTLHPTVTITDESKVGLANELHQKANEICFIANSCNFPIFHKPTCHVFKE
ncbi:MAG: OsmC family protein [Ginsengibacter sp.]